MPDNRSEEVHPGLWEFLMGILMVAVSGFLLWDSVKVGCPVWYLLGGHASALYIATIVLMVAGLVVLYAIRRHRLWGWIAWGTGAGIFVTGTLANAAIYAGGFPWMALVAAAAMFVAGTALAFLSMRRPDEPDH